MKLAARCFLFFLLMIFSVNNSFGQDSISRKMRITIAPLNAYTPASGVVQVGLQMQAGSRFAVAADYGIGFNKLVTFRNQRQKDRTYYKAKLEAKYYMQPKHKRSNYLNHSYLSVQGFYFPQQYLKENGYVTKNGKYYHYDSSTINRNVTAASFIIGNEHMIKNFVIDYYIGLGVRKRTIQHHTIGEREEIRYDYLREFSFPSADERQGTVYGPHLVFGLKLGYMLF